MAKKNNSNKTLIISIVSAVVGIGLLIGSYFIGYNVAKNEFHPVASEDSYVQNAKIVGVYKRSYYNNYNKSVDSYAIFREDGTCKYIEAIKTELSTTVDFNDRSQDCTYTYDESNKSGKFSINYPYTENGVKKDNITDYNFTFNYGSLMIGGASYGKIQ